MKRILIVLAALLTLCLFSGCADTEHQVDILTTTAPLYEFTKTLCNGTGITVDCLITENVSCLHDYTLQPKQLKSVEEAEILILSGAGLEDAFADLLSSARTTVDASENIPLLCADAHHHDHSHEHEEEDAHDPHIWLSPDCAKMMTENIFRALSEAYPQHSEQFLTNKNELLTKFDKLTTYAGEQLSDLSTRELVTFHDGFAYMADAFHLEILHAIEEESGREASASELIHLCELVTEHNLPCIFTERNGSVSAAQIISDETGAKIYQLDMAMSETGYFEAMYHNIDTLKEALG